MNKLAIAALVAASAVFAQAAAAQSNTARDRAVAKLTDSRDMSTSLPMNAPARASTGMLGGNERDRAIARLTDDRDMSTGFAHR